MLLSVRPLYRRILAATPIAISLWLMLCAITALWVPGQIKAAAENWGRQQGRILKLGELKINPFSWTLSIADLALADKDGTPLFALHAGVIELKPGQLLIGRLAFARIELEQALLSLDRPKGSDWNWSRFVHDVQSSEKSAEKPKSKTPEIMVDHFELSRGRLFAHDGNLESQPYRFDPVNLSLNDLSTLPVEGGYRLNATLDDGARLEWSGNLLLAPFGSAGQIKLTGLTLARAWPFVTPYVSLVPPDGTFAFESHYDVSTRSGFDLKIAPFSAAIKQFELRAPHGDSQFSLAEANLSGGTLDLSRHELNIAKIEFKGGNLKAVRARDGSIDWLDALKKEQAVAPIPAPSAPPPKTSPWRVNIAKVGFSDWQFAGHDGSVLRPYDFDMQLPSTEFAVRQTADGWLVDKLSARLQKLELNAGEGHTPLKLESASLAPSVVSLSSHTVSPGKVILSGVGVTLTRGSDGKIDLLSMFQPLTPRLKQSSSGEPTPSPWKIAPAELELSDSHLQWHDTVSGVPATLALNRLSGHAKLAENQDISASIKAQWAGGGSFDAVMGLTASNKKIGGSLSLQNIALAPLAPYAIAGTALKMAGGKVSGKLDWNLPANRRWQVAGGANIAGLAVMEPGQSDPLVGWDAIRVDGIQAHGGEPLAVNVNAIKLDHPRIRLRLDKQHNLNLKNAFAPAATSTPAIAANVKTKSPESPADQSKSVPPQVSIRTIYISKAEVDFADQGLNPGFATRMHDLSGSILGASTMTGRHSTVTVDGQVDTFGSVKIRGTLDPAAATDDSELSLGFQNISINSLTPYSENFAGWRLDDGRLNVDLRYTLKDKHMDGQNHVVIQSIVLGDEVNKPGVSRLPLRLAVALLEDSDGRIDLELPVTGSLDDPQFSYGHLIGQAISTLIKKVIASPFHALAHLFGSEGFDAVDFVPGQDAVSPPEREKLGKLANLLSKRPKLTLGIGGAYDPAVDLHAMARVGVDSEILAAAGMVLEPGMPVSRPDFDDLATRAAIKNAYGKYIGKLKLVAIVTTSKDDRDRYQRMRNELIAAKEKQIDQPALLAMAKRRAEAARATLLSAMPELANRIGLLPEQAATAGQDGIALELKLDTH